MNRKTFQSSLRSTIFSAAMLLAGLAQAEVISEMNGISVMGSPSISARLVESQKFNLTLTSKESVDLDLTTNLAELGLEMNQGDIEVSINPAHVTLAPNQPVSVTLTMKTKSMAPSFMNKELHLMASSQGNVLSQTSLMMSVAPIYIIRVTGGNPFDFDSAPEVLKFRPHTAGLQVLFQSFASKECVIHGSGAIPHQNTSKPLTPAIPDSNGQLQVNPNGGTYTLPLIMPKAGKDIKGEYTIHNVYEPTRNVIFNATMN